MRATNATQLAHYLAKPDLTKPVPGSPSVMVPSTFWLAARDARVASGRDPETGDRVELEPATMWLGAIGYMILLDQIGDALGRPSRETSARGIKRALALFSDLADRERRTIYALRCAFAHDYSLVNRGDAGNHLFRAIWEEESPLLVLPETEWSGDYENLGEDTTVNLLALTDLGESVIADVLQAYDDGDLALAVDAAEADHRYFVTITDGF